MLTEPNAGTHTDEQLHMPAQRFSPKFEPAAREALRIGIILLSTDLGTERELRRLMPPEVGAFVNRVESYLGSAADERAAHVAQAGALILPDDRIDCLAYACTSGSLVVGHAALMAAVQTCRPGVPFCTPRSAARAAFKQLGVSRLALLTPYDDALSARLARALIEDGLDVVRLGSFDLRTDHEIAALSPDAIADAAIDLLKSDAQAIYIACNALQSSRAIDTIELHTGRPVVTSTQALIWHALRLGGYVPRIGGPGELLA
jgi:maleate isomerase